MKPTITVVVTLIALTAMAVDKFVDQMRTNIQLVYEAKSIDELQQVVNSFERIGNAEKSRWEPFYYAAFGEIMMATRQTDAAIKESYLDKAEDFLSKARAINPSESEVVTLEGFVHTIRLSVDPATRGQKYSMLSMQAFGKALKLNPENPRALSLMAQMQYGTAQFFGSSSNEACATLSKALEKFDTYHSDNILAPQWGRKNAEDFKVKCN